MRNSIKPIVAAAALAVAPTALAGQPLGAPLGVVLGVPLGEILPIAGSGLFVVAAASLALGIYIVRRKRGR